MTVIACPTCTGLIEIDGGIGALVECPDCGELWVFASERPPLLVYAQDREDEGSFADEDEHRLSG